MRWLFPLLFAVALVFGASYASAITGCEPRPAPLGSQAADLLSLTQGGHSTQEIQDRVAFARSIEDIEP